MAKTCPISLDRIDTTIVRLIAVQVLINAILFLFTSAYFFIGVLFFDFTLRVLKLKKWSPFLQVALWIRDRFSLKVKLCDEAPKRFALKFGLVIIVIIAVFSFLHYDLYAKVLMFMLMLCAFAEAAYDYCVGCHIYRYLKYFIKPRT